MPKNVMTARKRNLVDFLPDSNRVRGEDGDEESSWDHALVTSDAVSCAAMPDSRPSKSPNMTARDASVFATLASLVNEASDDSGSVNGDEARSQFTCESDKAKIIPEPLMRIAEEPDEDIFFEQSLNSPSVRSLRRHFANYGSPRSQMSPYSKNTTRAEGNNGSTKLRSDDSLSCFSQPATEIMGNLSSPRHRDETMSLFSQPATEVMGNLTSSRFPKDDSFSLFSDRPPSDRFSSARLQTISTTESSLFGEKFLPDNDVSRSSSEQRFDDESLLGNGRDGIEASEMRDDESLFSEEEETEAKKIMSLMIDPPVEKVVEALTGTPIVSNRRRNSTSEDKIPRAQIPSRSDKVDKDQELTIPVGSDEFTEKLESFDHNSHSGFVRKIPQPYLVAFVAFAFVALIAAVVIIAVRAPTWTNSNQESSSPTLTGSQRTREAWRVAVAVSGSESLNDMSSAAFKSFEWISRGDIAPLPTSDIAVQERFIVGMLYFATQGESWKQQRKFLSKDNICEWNDGMSTPQGVVCNEESRVTQIVLSENRLVGTIPSEIGLLESLEILDLSKNFLFGSIPAELANLQELSELDLMSNSLQGEIPSALGRLNNLLSLSLSTNNFTGSLPSELGGLGNLQVLSAGNNHLVGDIPESFQQLNSLVELNLFRNQLEGDIPEGIAALPNLSVLNFASNQFTGSLTSDFCQAGGHAYESFWADCRGNTHPPMVECDCCTICCERDGDILTC